QELEGAPLLVEHVAAGHVRRHQVGREPDALALAAEHAPERAHQQGLPQPGRTLEQHVPAGEHGDERVFDDLVLPDQGPPDFGADAIKLFFERECVHSPLLWLRAVLPGRGALPSPLLKSPPERWRRVPGRPGVCWAVVTRPASASPGPGAARCATPPPRRRTASPCRRSGSGARASGPTHTPRTARARGVPRAGARTASRWRGRAPRTHAGWPRPDRWGVRNAHPCR